MRLKRLIIVLISILTATSLNSQDSYYKYYNTLTGKFELTIEDSNKLVNKLDGYEYYREMSLAYYNREKFLKDDLKKMELQKVLIDMQKRDISRLQQQLQLQIDLKRGLEQVDREKDKVIKNLNRKVKVLEFKQNILEITTTGLTVVTIVGILRYFLK